MADHEGPEVLTQLERFLPAMEGMFDEETAYKISKTFAANPDIASVIAVLSGTPADSTSHGKTVTTSDTEGKVTVMPQSFGIGIADNTINAKFVSVDSDVNNEPSVTSSFVRPSNITLQSGRRSYDSGVSVSSVHSETFSSHTGEEWINIDKVDIACKSIIT